MEKTITIAMESYVELIRDSRFLAILEAMGVDNWEGYEAAQEQMEEDYGR